MITPFSRYCQCSNCGIYYGRRKKHFKNTIHIKPEKKAGALLRLHSLLVQLTMTLPPAIINWRYSDERLCRSCRRSGRFICGTIGLLVRCLNFSVAEAFSVEAGAVSLSAAYTMPRLRAKVIAMLITTIFFIYLYPFSALNYSPSSSSCILSMRHRHLEKV
jgi:hypothetical protein